LEDQTQWALTLPRGPKSGFGVHGSMKFESQSQAKIDVTIRPPSWDEKEMENRDKNSPSHNKVPKGFMFDLTKGFGENVRPVKVGIYLHYFKITCSNVILESVPLQRNVFGPDLGTLTVSQNNA